mmetsp:Transcript_11392/g.20692  ORF Transcript_11392/g.20692 Transcript_11392/m.20692 type:complete len:96 (+) Transcript_11392:335-622(+)
MNDMGGGKNALLYMAAWKGCLKKVSNSLSTWDAIQMSFPRVNIIFQWKDSHFLLCRDAESSRDYVVQLLISLAACCCISLAACCCMCSRENCQQQ